MVSRDNLFVRVPGASQRHRRASFTSLNKASERRRGELVRNTNIRAAPHVIPGFKELLGAGEILIEVTFPVRFIQIPVFTYGASLAPGTQLVDGSYPVVSAVVAYWQVKRLDEGEEVSREHFTGAELAVTASGPTDQRLLLNWQFSGMALTNPVGSERSVPELGENGRIIS